MSYIELRTEIRELVSAIEPLDNLEEQHLEFTKKWIDSGAELFRVAKPDKPKTHLVAYFAIYDESREAFLLVDHKKAGLWLPPGGHVDRGEHPHETVKREGQEELAIDVEFLSEDPLFLTVTKTVGHIASHTDVSLWYILKGKYGTEFDYDSREFKSVRWFPKERIPFELAEPHMARLIKKIGRGFAY